MLSALITEGHFYHSEGEITVAKKRRQGRPPTFLPPDRRYLAELIRQHGIAGASEKQSLPLVLQLSSKSLASSTCHFQAVEDPKLPPDLPPSSGQYALVAAVKPFQKHI
jgi:hypothetical protein